MCLKENVDRVPPNARPRHSGKEPRGMGWNRQRKALFEATRSPLRRNENGRESETLDAHNSGQRASSWPNHRRAICHGWFINQSSRQLSSDLDSCCRHDEQVGGTVARAPRAPHGGRRRANARPTPASRSSTPAPAPAATSSAERPSDLSRLPILGDAWASD